MSILSSVRNKLETKVFDKLGSSITITSVSHNDSYGGYAQTADTTGTATSATGVPFNSPGQMFTKSKFGTLVEGQTSMIVKYDQAVTAGSTVTWNGTNYEVVKIETFDLSSGVVAKELLLTKRLG